MLIINKSANASNNVMQLRDSLLLVRQLAEQLQRQADNSSAAELEQVQGVPLALNTPYLATLASILTVLQSPSVELFIGAIA